jgi:hypothetical protein
MAREPCSLLNCHTRFKHTAQVSQQVIFQKLPPITLYPFRGMPLGEAFHGQSHLLRGKI